MSFRSYAFHHDCSRKRAYPSRERAEEVARHQMELNPSRHLRVYHCDACFNYHLTHKPPL
jgi:hypothetical protein